MLIIVQDFKEAELGGLLHNINRGISQEEFQSDRRLRSHSSKESSQSQGSSNDMPWLKSRRQATRSEKDPASKVDMKAGDNTSNNSELASAAKSPMQPTENGDLIQAKDLSPEQ